VLNRKFTTFNSFTNHSLDVGCKSKKSTSEKYIIMNIPNLPTDNLYKFLALTGIIILIFSIAITETRLTELESESDYYLTQQGELYFDIQSLNSDLDRITDKEIFELKRLKNEIRIRVFKLSRTKELLLKKSKQTRTVFRWSIFGVLSGLLISVFGFVLWYNRVQRYLDYKLKLETKD
jgi:hypothetical protein